MTTQVRTVVKFYLESLSHGIQVLHKFNIPQDKLQRQAQFMFTHSAKDKMIILNYWLDLLMLVIPSAKELLEK